MDQYQTQKSPLTLSLSRKGRGDGAARYSFEYGRGARSEVVTLSLAISAGGYGCFKDSRLAKASLRGRGWPRSGRVRGGNVYEGLYKRYADHGHTSNGSNIVFVIDGSLLGQYTFF